MQKVTCSLDEKVVKWYAESYGRHTPGCEGVLELWPSLVTKCIPEICVKFSEPELLLLFDSFNGTLLSPGLPMRQVFLGNVSDNCTLNNQDIYFGVDRNQMFEKCGNLSLPEIYILLEWLVRTWENSTDLIGSLCKTLSMK